MGRQLAGKGRKNGLFSLILILTLLTGLSLLLYPTISDWWNSFHQSRAIASYVETVEELDDDAYAQLWEDAQAYNEALAQDNSRFQPSEEESVRYNELLNLSGTGIMGYVEIPSIDVALPIYHGTDEAVLQVAVGHIEGSSLPVGGPGTHTVLSGHRGLPSATLFTDLDQLDMGDVFLLHVLGETLTYQVDQIRIVEPDDVSLLALEEGEDLCTLVTCTPYGVNSHRLLVRGYRVENLEEEQVWQISGEAGRVDFRLVALALALPILLLLLFWTWLRTGRGRKGK
mgnify:FL=1